MLCWGGEWERFFFLGFREMIIVILSVIWTLSFVKYGVLAPSGNLFFCTALVQGGQKLTVAAAGVCLLFSWHALLLNVSDGLCICSDSELLFCKEIIQICCTMRAVEMISTSNYTLLPKSKLDHHPLSFIKSTHQCMFSWTLLLYRRATSCEPRKEFCFWRWKRKTQKCQTPMWERSCGIAGEHALWPW